MQNQRQKHLQRQQRRRKPIITVMGTLISPHYIKTPNNRYLRLSERRDDDLGVLMDTLINKGATLKEIALEINYTERHTARLINQRYGQTLTSLNKNRKQK